MKKIVSLLIILLVAFTGCKKEKTLRELIIGKWEFYSAKMVQYRDNVKTAEFTDYYDDNEETIEVRSDNTGTHYTDGTADDEFTWELSGNNLTVYLTDQTIEAVISATEDVFTIKQTTTEMDGDVEVKTEKTITAHRM
jgi:hypothetical protein